MKIRNSSTKHSDILIPLSEKTMATICDDRTCHTGSTGCSMQETSAIDNKQQYLVQHAYKQIANMLADCASNLATKLDVGRSLLFIKRCLLTNKTKIGLRNRSHFSRKSIVNSWLGNGARTNLLKAIQVITTVHFIMNLPTVSAVVNEFDIGDIVPTVYGQLAQGAVIAGFGVLCSTGQGEWPVDALADGPLSSISSAVWLWRHRRLAERTRELTDISETRINGDVHPNGSIKQRAVGALPGIATSVSAFLLYFLSSLDKHTWKWALLVSGLGIMSEGTRLMATWLTTTCLDYTYISERDIRFGDPSVVTDVQQRAFVKWEDSKLRAVRSWAEFSDVSKAEQGHLSGYVHQTWHWAKYGQATAALTFFCLASVLAILSAGSLVASGDTSLSAGILGFIVCICANGHLRRDNSRSYMSPQQYESILAAARLSSLAADIIDEQYGFLSSETFIFRSLMTTGSTFVYNVKKYQAYKIQSGLTVDMHDVYHKYAYVFPNLDRFLSLRSEATGRSIILETADALYCRALLLIRHAHTCTSGVPRMRGTKCNVNTMRLLSAVLLASEHTHCNGVREILTGVKSWMNHEDLIWSIIGRLATLEMMVVPQMQRQLESTTALELALRVCQMSMYENVPAGDMLEAVPTALYYLLTESTVLASASARVVERAIDKYGAVSMIAALDEVIVFVDKYTIECRGKLHNWPGGFIPIILEEAVTSQPPAYTLAKAVFGPKLLKHQSIADEVSIQVSNLALVS